MNSEKHNIIIRPIQIPSELEIAFSVIKELRSTPDFSNFKWLSVEAAKRDDFQLIGAFLDNKCIGVMGMRILFDLTHSKHLYIDDLVVTESQRSNGIGKKLLHFAETFAVKSDCYFLRLCTGIENTGSQRLYESQGWIKRSFAFKKPLKHWTIQ